MKKVFVYVMGLAALLAVSCNNKDNSTTPGAPATQELAQVLKFSNPVQIGDYAFQSIELTEASRYIAEYTESKASAGASIRYGKYTYFNGTFNLDGLGSLKVEGSKVTINPSFAGGSAVEAQATVTRSSAKDQSAVNACRNWTITKIVFDVSGKTKEGQTIGGSKMLNKLDMKEIAEYAKSWGLAITDEEMAKMAKYSVKEICMTSAGSCVVAFTGTDTHPFYADLNLNGSNFTFSFSQEDIPILSGGKFSGTLSFSGNSCIISGKANVVYKESTFEASLDMALTEVQ